MPDPMLTVTVAWSPAPRQVVETRLRLPQGATVRQAVQAWAAADPTAAAGPELLVGVWGRKAPWEQLLRDRDRVEIYRPLRVDPKVARRERFSRQGKRSTGLFARRRTGGKQGY
jgi:putative ubiquitin-RnfH superfamily antitoxin RatB of RatAB toxin-antitoxin module